eukprot:5071625-Pyramimonas_sp.AAC.1
MTSWVGGKIDDVMIKQYSEAYLASDLRAHRSASAQFPNGLRVELLVYNTNVPRARLLTSVQSVRRSCSVGQ